MTSVRKGWNKKVCFENCFHTWVSTKYAILTPLMAILEVACELALPRLMAAIVDVGIVEIRIWPTFL